MGSNKRRFYVDMMASNDGVTGSCNLCVIKLPNMETVKFCVDVGMYQEKEFLGLNHEMLFNPEEIEFVILTHNHIDHIGRLPMLAKKNFFKPVYTTEVTANFLMPKALQDSCNVIQDNCKKKYNIEKPIYDKEDVTSALALVKPCKYDKTYQVHPNVKVTFFKNMHLVGAAITLVQISYEGYDDINLLFTGDYNKKNVFLEPEELPDWVKELPITIVQESTYGTMDSTEIVESFETDVTNALNEGKTVVALAYSLGRMQEVAYKIKCMQDSGRIKDDVEIYFDGPLALRYMKEYHLYGIKPEMCDFLPRDCTFVDKENREKVIIGSGKKIIVTSSGSGSYGPAQFYLPEYLQREDALIIFTGFTPKDTFGGRLKNAQHGETLVIGGREVVKVADVKFTNEFSAHAKADELIEFLKQFNTIKLLLINHGEHDVKEDYVWRVREEVQLKQAEIFDRTYCIRVDSYGFVKSISSKF